MTWLGGRSFVFLPVCVRCWQVGGGYIAVELAGIFKFVRARVCRGWCGDFETRVRKPHLLSLTPSVLPPPPSPLPPPPTVPRNSCISPVCFRMCRTLGSDVTLFVRRKEGFLAGFDVRASFLVLF